jgi:phage terminase large subunit-like protein
LSSSLDSLRRLARAGVALQARAEAEPLRWFDRLPHQQAFMEATPKNGAAKKLLRTGNRLGKTTAGAEETIHYAMGSHPYDPREPIAEQWVITSSWKQSLSVQEALWKFAPREALEPGQRFDRKTGFGQHNPSLIFSNGAVVRIRTAKQDTMDLTSAQVGRVWFDEPPRNERIYGECLARTRTAGGMIAITMTPINAPTEWIRDYVSDGRIADLHYPLTPEAMVHTRSGRRYRTDDGRECDAQWIEEIRAETPAHEVPVTIDGEWECRLTDRWFSAFVSDPKAEGSHVLTELPDEDWDLSIGIDHGTGNANQIAILLAVSRLPGPTGYRRMIVLDEAWSPGMTSPEQDAREIVSMLRRWGWRWGDLHRVYGDIPATNDDGSRKGNLDIEDALRRELGLRSRRQLKPRIWSAKRGRGRGAGSKRLGLLWLHRRLVERNLLVYSRCHRVIASLDKWCAEPKSEHMHPIDALIYACLDPIRRGPVSAGAPGRPMLAVR